MFSKSLGFRWGCFPTDTAITWTLVDFICFCRQIYGPTCASSKARMIFSELFHIPRSPSNPFSSECPLSTKYLHPPRNRQLNMTQSFAKTANEFIIKTLYQEGKTKSVQQNYCEYMTRDRLGSGFIKIQMTESILCTMWYLLSRFTSCPILMSHRFSSEVPRETAGSPPRPRRGMAALLPRSRHRGLLHVPHFQVNHAQICATSSCTRKGSVQPEYVCTGVG